MLYRFYVDFTDRWGERDVAVVLATDLADAEQQAGCLAGMGGSRDVRVDPRWDMAVFPDGRLVLRWNLQAAIAA